jgi:acyl carrier protein
MTTDDIKNVIVDALTRIAPEIDPASIQPSVNFRDQLDLDSMDFLNFVLALHDRLGIEIPEVDYPHLYTLDGAEAYLASKTGVTRGEQSASRAHALRNDSVR